MITCNLKGGFCNMLFQIAAMTSFAKDNNAVVSFPNLLDQIKKINDDDFHNPNLKHADEYLTIFKNLNLIHEPVNIKKTIYVPFSYVKLKFKDETNYVGFFQDELFFAHNRDYILNLFEPKDEIKQYIEKKYEDLLKTETCAIHVRRGDYVKLQNAHVLQDMNYFNEAMKCFDNIKQFVIFSDDIEWCEKNFIGENFVFIKEERDYLELFLMSMCSHQIISNSSFSWWGVLG